MKKNFWFIFFLLPLYISAQIRPVGKPINLGTNPKFKDSLSFNRDSIDTNIKTWPVNQYKKFNILSDTIAMDTTLDVRHYYAFNELLRDNFTLLPFANYGQPANQLVLNYQTHNILPGFVATTKNTDNWTHHEIPFYKTPTPYSDLTYLNGITQGQLLHAVFATNVKPNLNLAAGYRGLSSLGLYKNSIVSSERFFGSLNYLSRNNKYKLKFYYYTYNKNNEENGGLKDVQQFENGGETFSDRGRIDVRLSDTENLLKNKRLFAEQQYGILNNKFIIGNDFTYEKKSYDFSQKTSTKLIGETFNEGEFKDSLYLNRVENYTSVRFQTRIFNIKTGIRFIHQVYGTDSTKIINNETIPQKLIYDDATWDSNLQFQIKNIKLKSRLQLGFTQNLLGYYFETKAAYRFSKQARISAKLTSTSKRPDFKFIMYQSNYKPFNWYHPEFKNELNQQLVVKIKHQKWGKLKFTQQIINNFTYFDLDSLPRQNTTGIKYTGLQYQKDFQYKKWGLTTDLLLQQVLDGSDIYPLPTYVVRTGIFYSNYYYNRNLYVQTGIDFKYFDSFYAPAYNPVTAEFVLQNKQKTGNYPWLNFFINFKVKRFRFYFKLEHINALVEKNPNYYAAPLQPVRDFSIRFGLRWIFLN